MFLSEGGDPLPPRIDVGVCTIEKANSICNRMQEEGRLHEIGAVVADEVHLIGDAHRGYILELLLTKLLVLGRAARRSAEDDGRGPALQIVCLSGV